MPPDRPRFEGIAYVVIKERTEIKLDDYSSDAPLPAPGRAEELFWLSGNTLILDRHLVDYLSKHPSEDDRIAVAPFPLTPDRLALIVEVHCQRQGSAESHVARYFFWGEPQGSATLPLKPPPHELVLELASLDDLVSVSLAPGSLGVKRGAENKVSIAGAGAEKELSPGQEVELLAQERSIPVSWEGPRDLVGEGAVEVRPGVFRKAGGNAVLRTRLTAAYVSKIDKYEISQ
jgi:hypothetical protein